MAALSPEDILRPGVASDPGVRAQPTAALPSQIVDPTGQAMVGLSENISNSASLFRELTKKRQGAEDRAFNDHIQLELNKRYPTIEAESLNSPDALKPEYVNLLDKKLADQQKDTVQEVLDTGKFNPSQEGREAATHSAMQLREAAARRAAINAHNQRLKGLVDGTGTGILEIARSAGSNGDLQGGLERAESSIKSLQGVLAPDKFEDLRKAAQAQVVESVIQGYKDRGEHEKARGLLDINRGYAASPIEREIGAVAGQRGIEPAYMIALARVESAMNPLAKAQTSSASGLFQFTWGTGQQYGLPRDASTAPIGQQATAAAQFTLDNQRVLQQSLGRAPSHGELYLAHFLGAGDASKVLTANPGTPVENLIGQASVAANPHLRGKTAGEVADWASSKIMGAGGGGVTKYISEATRVQLLNGIETKQHQMEERAERQQAKAIKEIGDSFLKDAYDKSHAGTLTLDHVQQIKPFMSPAEHKGLLNMLATDEGHANDPATIAELQPSVHTDTPDLFMSKLNRAFSEKRIKAETFRSMANQNYSANKDDRPASPYKSGREMVNVTLDPGLLSGSAAQILRVSRGRALVEFDNWAAANPDAKREDYISTAHDIINRYEPIQYDEVKSATGLSRFFGRRTKQSLVFNNQKEVEEFINTAEDSLSSEISRLTPAQQDFEIKNLNQWREILTREMAAKERARAAPKKP